MKFVLILKMSKFLTFTQIRMARAGAHIIGTNCKFDPFISLETMRRMKAGLDAENLHPYLMCQPLGFRTPDVNHFGAFHLPEFPFGEFFLLNTMGLGFPVDKNFPEKMRNFFSYFSNIFATFRIYSRK